MKKSELRKMIKEAKQELVEQYIQLLREDAEISEDDRHKTLLKHVNEKMKEAADSEKAIAQKISGVNDLDKFDKKVIKLGLDVEEIKKDNVND